MRRGWAVWNIEYRRLGEGGGWPATFEDVAAAIDHLPLLEAQLDLEGVTVIGHSAGGHLALWAAGRERLAAGAPGAAPVVRARRVMGQAAVCDLAGAYALWRGGAVNALMGGSPSSCPSATRSGDPIELRAAAGCRRCSSTAAEDETVSVELAAATQSARGLPARRGRARRDHRARRADTASHIDPRGESWAAVTSWLGRPVPAAGLTSP